MMAMQRRLVEQQVSREQEALYRRRLDDEVARLAEEGAVGMHRRRIQEEVLLLRCPRCQAPFLDFTGCVAAALRQRRTDGRTDGRRGEGTGEGSGG